MDELKLFVEINIEKIGSIIVASNVREATKAEIKDAKLLHKKGKCNHKLIYDKEGYPHHERTCGICNNLLDLV